MDIELTRVDYTLVGLTYPKCMRLLPSHGHGMPQKVAVADRDGVLQVFSVKKGETYVAFKTLPGPPISCLQLGGALGTIQDKIFISSENEVRGYTKKGKLFLGFDTNLTDPIKSMYVSGSNLLICGNHVYSHFYDCKETSSFLCGDRINDVVALAFEKTNRLISVLACEDRVLRVLDRQDILHNIEVESTPTVLHLYNNNGGDNGDQVLYGTADGRIGLVQIGKSDFSHTWILNDFGYKSAIVCMDCYDITGDGLLDLLIGRQDGIIEVYSFNSETEEGNATLRFSYTCNESITSIQGGVVGNSGYDEIVVTSYTGWLFGLTTEVMEKKVGVSTGTFTGTVNISQDAKLKIMHLSSEIEEIEHKVKKEREKYQAATVDKTDGLSALPFIAVNDKIILCKEDASYLLSLEVQTAIDNILLQSDVPLDILDVERNSAVVSHSACDPSSGNHLLVTYRCQININRLELKIRTIEGQHGTLQVYITPLIQPKSCQVKKYQIHPLSLHTRCHHFDPNRPYNVLTLKGPFSFAEIHSWIGFCLPEIPNKPPAGDKNTFTFVSTFLDTMLQCSYSKGEAEFKSDNVSTISILKDVLTKEATKKKIKLDILCEINEDSVSHTLRLIHPRLESQFQLAKQISVLEALKDLQTFDSDSENSLLPEYKQLLKNEKAILTQYKHHPSQLDRLYGMVTDLYIDKNKFKGINVKGKVPQLLSTLGCYKFEDLINFFLETSL